MIRVVAVVLQDESVDPAELLEAVPDSPGVYAVYSADEALQYIGISRKMATSVSAHVEDLPELAHMVRAISMPSAGKGKDYQLDVLRSNQPRAVSR